MNKDTGLTTLPMTISCAGISVQIILYNVDVLAGSVLEIMTGLFVDLQLLEVERDMMMSVASKHQWSGLLCEERECRKNCAERLSENPISL